MFEELMEIKNQRQLTDNIYKGKLQLIKLLALDGVHQRLIDTFMGFSDNSELNNLIKTKDGLNINVIYDFELFKQLVHEGLIYKLERVSRQKDRLKAYGKYTGNLENTILLIRQADEKILSI